MNTTALLSLIPHGHEHAISRDQLSHLLGVDDRKCRKLIQKARDEGAIILNRQDGAGYYIADETDAVELIKQYRQDTSRALSILRRRKTIRRLLCDMGVSL